jgi:5,10-methylene-tetrahydrofolate dehydrogenase/methenyl tetrahydrofolate cyclohydrolase
MLLDGKKIRDRIEKELAHEIHTLKDKPTLAILQVGLREDSTAYINQKRIFAEKIGAFIIHKQYPETVEENEIIHDIHNFNRDSSVHGIILQIPIPEHLNRKLLIDAIDPHKDVDGLSSANTKKLWEKDLTGYIPATTKGILALLEAYKIDIQGKKVVVVGRSTLVGKPTALALLNKNATVTICHSKTENLSQETLQADILIVATGHPLLIKKNFVKPGQIVIDVGINLIKGTKLEEEIPGKKFVGDVDFENVKDIVEAITPVPGGVGPLTVASLFENLLTAYKQSKI